MKTNQRHCINCIHYYRYKKNLAEDTQICHVKFPEIEKNTPLEIIKTPNIKDFYIDLQNKNNDCPYYLSIYKVITLKLIWLMSALFIVIWVIRAI